MRERQAEGPRPLIPADEIGRKKARPLAGLSFSGWLPVSAPGFQEDIKVLI
jgi:hypothetical protein